MEKNYAVYSSENGTYRVDDEHYEFWVMLRENAEYEGVIDKEWAYSTHEEMAEDWDGENYIEGDEQIEAIWCDQAQPDVLTGEYPMPYMMLAIWHQYWLV